MRVVLVSLLALGLGACGTTKLALRAEPPKLAAEWFFCPPDPGAWPEDASDNEIAANVRTRMAAGQSCRQQLRMLCQSLDLNGQVEPKGSCPPDPRAKREKTASEPQ